MVDVKSVASGPPPRYLAHTDSKSLIRMMGAPSGWTYMTCRTRGNKNGMFKFKKPNDDRENIEADTDGIRPSGQEEFIKPKQVASTEADSSAGLYRRKRSVHNRRR